MNKSLVPKIRFKGFDDELQNELITNLFDIKTGGDIDKNNFQTEKLGDFIYPVYTNSIILNGLQGYSKTYKFEEKCITITAWGTIGFCKARFEKFYPIVRLLVCLPKNQSFNILYFEKILSKINYLQESTGVPQLTAPTLKKILINYSNNINEQTKVAQFFAIIDKKIELVKEQLSLLAKQKQYYLNNMFANEKSYPQIRFKGFNDEWENKKIGEILNYQQPTKFIIKDKIENQGKIPVLTANKSFVLGYVNEKNIYENIPVIIFDDFTMDMKYVNFKFMIKSSAIKILKSNNNNINLFYVFNLLKNLKLFSSDHKRYYISYVSEINVLFPNIYEQTKVAQFFTIIDRKIELVKEQLSLLAKQKQYYLNNMFI